MNRASFALLALPRSIDSRQLLCLFTNMGSELRLFSSQNRETPSVPQITNHPFKRTIRESKDLASSKSIQPFLAFCSPLQPDAVVFCSFAPFCFHFLNLKHLQDICIHLWPKYSDCSLFQSCDERDMKYLVKKLDFETLGFAVEATKPGLTGLDFFF